MYGISFVKQTENLWGLRLDFNSLNGPQRKVLREAITEAFDRDELNGLMVDTGFGALEDLTGPKGFKSQAFDVIQTFHREGRLEPFVLAVLDEESDRPSLRKLNTQLGFVDDHSEDAIKRVSGLSLERSVRNSGFSNPYLWANTLTCLTRKICQIRIVDGVQVQYGTGFLVGPDLVLTNFHVMEDVIEGRISPEKVQLTFDYAELAEGRADAIGCLLTDDWKLSYSPYSNADLAPNAGDPQPDELDYAVVRIDRAVGDIAAPDGSHRGWVDLAATPAMPADGAIVYILQHPAGDTVKQSVGTTKPPVNPVRLRYDADTDKGSSGGMVLDERLQAYALHHAGDPDAKIKAHYNQGIPLDLIHQSLTAQETI